MVKGFKFVGDDLATLDAEIQNFLFIFLPYLISELSTHTHEPLTSAQADPLDAYFVRAIALAAIAYPRRAFFFRTSGPYNKIRGLQRAFRQFNQEALDANRRKEVLDGMCDLLHEFSQSYHNYRDKVRLTPLRAAQIPQLQRQTRATIVKLSGQGLEAIDRFVEQVSVGEFTIVSGEKSMDDARDDQKGDAGPTVGPLRLGPQVAGFLLGLVDRAIKADPAVRFAMALVGVTAAGTGISMLTGGGRATVVLLALMIFAMILYVVFANIKPHQTRGPALLLVWAVSVIFVVSLCMVMSAVAFGVPQDLREFLVPRGS